MMRVMAQWGVRMAGARVVQISPRDPYPPSSCHGVVITGGHDVDPVLYAEPPHVQARYDSERDAFESAMIEHALENDLPLLGICRGAQLLNVRLGGSLHQDLYDHRRRTSHRRTILPLKTLCVEEGTALHGLLGVERLRINSLHNQAIDRLGENLRVSARDLDDIVQAVEDPDRRFTLGVQWHPEFLVFHPRQYHLFQGFVAAARRMLIESA
jgi:putative glutamine amidotransferase